MTLPSASGGDAETDRKQVISAANQTLKTFVGNSKPPIPIASGLFRLVSHFNLDFLSLI